MKLYDAPSRHILALIFAKAHTHPGQLHLLHAPHGTCMEMNKDASAQCLARAQACFANQEYDKALKFVQKSIRLFELPGASVLQRKIVAAMQGGNSAANGTGPGAKASAAGAAPRPTPATAEPATPNFTPEQQELAQRVLRCKTHYEVLSVSTTVSEPELKKAYRKARPASSPPLFSTRVSRACCNCLALCAAGTQAPSGQELRAQGRRRVQACVLFCPAFALAAPGRLTCATTCRRVACVHGAQ